MEKLSQPVIANEIVLFRTHAEMLTDQRIIMHGNTVPLSRIERTYVRPVWHFVPFLIGRLLLGLAAVGLILSGLGLIHALPGSALIQLFLGVTAGTFAVLLTWLVPTHALWIQTRNGEKQVMIRSTSAAHLHEVRGKIEAARRARHEIAQGAPRKPGYADIG